MSSKSTGNRVERDARLQWVPLSKIRVNPLAQRELNTARVDKIASEMDLEQIGAPTVNLRDSWFYVIDGQHRVVALKKWLGEGNWEDQAYQCWTYIGLSEGEEAEKFLKLNDTLTVSTFDKFTKGIKAGRAEETDIHRIVLAQNLRISRQKGGGSIGAVAALRKVYRRGPNTLARTLRIVRDAYGDAGLDASVIEGIGMLTHRYNGDLEDETAVKRLAQALGGVNGLLNSAENLRVRTGNPRIHCVAAAAVEIYNRGRGGAKLPSWWKTEESA